MSEQVRTKEPLKLTKSETAILDYYQSLKEEKFCQSLKTIARATGINEKTVRRANEKFMTLGILSWVRGHGGQGNIVSGLRTAG